MSRLSVPIAYFITPHGFGHAARASAVMEALHHRSPSIHFEIFTQVPIWFFEDSLSGPFSYHAVMTDPGLVQIAPLKEDLDSTVTTVRAFYPPNPSWIEELAGVVRAKGCRLVICDISPLGIMVAEKAGLPAVLVENFTWDWIYEEYLAEAPRLRPVIEYLRTVFAQATCRVQSRPICVPGKADLTSNPVSRLPREGRDTTRGRLGIPAGGRAVLITMGGIETRYSLPPALTAFPDFTFVIPGGASEPERKANAILLPHRSSFFHPDLVQACDAIVGKVGYSTVSEAYLARRPFAYISRRRFRESPVLSEFIEREMSGFEIAEESFRNGNWVQRLPELFGPSPHPGKRTNGAEEIAAFLLRRFGLPGERNG